MLAAGSSASVTLVAVLGSAGLVPTSEPESAEGLQLSGYTAPHPQSRLDAGPSTIPDAVSGSDGEASPDESSEVPPDQSGSADGATANPPPPADSGTGRRVVFAIADQRVWLVEADGTVARTYLVSGSLTDNLEPGSYEVYSTSPTAVGIDDSGTMRYMVRFAHGEQAAIGFHDIPVKDGEPVQSRAELGEPRSHGCIRQARPDARALWRFAPVGTRVVVVD